MIILGNYIRNAMVPRRRWKAEDAAILGHTATNITDFEIDLDSRP